MSRPIGNYTPQSFLPQQRRQSWKVWSIGLAVVAGWTFLILLAPLARLGGAETLAAPVYAFFSYICHQQPERSFHLDAHQFAVCSRCFGVYFGLFAGVAIYPLFRRIEEIEPFPRIWLFLAMIPIGIDWSLGVFGIWENTHLSRFITGTILGAACGIFIVPALVEIFRNLKGAGKIKRLSR